jgi:hypothetical protein
MMIQDVQTAYTLAGLYLALNAETYQNRLRYYILTELLGGVGDENECKTHTAAWFETFPLEFWTIQSRRELVFFLLNLSLDLG